jgi:hypothetical protein
LFSVNGQYNTLKIFLGPEFPIIMPGEYFKNIEKFLFIFGIPLSSVSGCWRFEPFVVR